MHVQKKEISAQFALQNIEIYKWTSGKYEKKNKRKKLVQLVQMFLNPIQARGSLGTPQRFSSITLRAFELILWNLVTFPKI